MEFDTKDHVLLCLKYSPEWVEWWRYKNKVIYPISVEVEIKVEAELGIAISCVIFYYLHSRHHTKQSLHPSQT